MEKNYLKKKNTFRHFASLKKFRKTGKIGIISEAEYYKSVSAKSRILPAEDVDSFIENYPESPYINQAWYNLGEYQFERRQYMVAVRRFQNIDRKDLAKMN